MKGAVGEGFAAIGSLFKPATLGIGPKLGDNAGRVGKGSTQYGTKEEVEWKQEFIRGSVESATDIVVTPMVMKTVGAGISKGKEIYKNYKLNNSFTGKLYSGTRNPNIDFLNSKGKSTLSTHANKHGYTSPETYLEDARNFLEKDPTLTTQSFISSEGTYFRYDKATNEFGIINKYGGISTYYKPENGKLYWLEQIEKYAPK